MVPGNRWMQGAVLSAAVTMGMPGQAGPLPAALASPSMSGGAFQPRGNGTPRGAATPLPAARAAPVRAGPAPDVAACLAAAAAHHRVNPDLLHAIAAVESGFNPQAMGPPNRNGTHDIGLMQVNSSWLPRLAGYGIDARRLREPCVSAYVGAWILADNIRRHGPVWRAVGAYNARTPSRQVVYVGKVQRALAQTGGVSAVGPGPGSVAPGR